MEADEQTLRIWEVTCRNHKRGRTTVYILASSLAQNKVLPFLKAEGCLISGCRNRSKFMLQKRDENWLLTQFAPKHPNALFFIEDGGKIVEIRKISDFAEVPNAEPPSHITKIEEGFKNLHAGGGNLPLLDIDKVMDHLDEKIVDEDHIKAAIRTILVTAQYDREPREGPLGSILIVGPTGTGKTQIAKSLAEAIHGSESELAMIKGDILSEGHTPSSLLGSPVGYVGSEDLSSNMSGAAVYQTERGRMERPWAVVLYDEITEAHPNVHKHLLTVLDEGVIPLRSGKPIDLRKAIIILTSNAGAKEIDNAIDGGHKLGFRVPKKDDHDRFKEPGKRREKVAREALERIFKPQFLGRLSAIVVSRWLDENQIEEVLMRRVRAFNQHFMPNIVLELTSEAVQHLIREKEGFDLKSGVRGLKNTFDREIKMRVVEMFGTGKIPRGTKVVVGVKDGEFTFQLSPLPIVGEAQK